MSEDARETADRPIDGSRARYVLLILTLIGVVNWADRSIVAILTDPIKHALNVSDTSMGLLNGFGFAFFYAVAAIPISRLADRGSRRNVLAISLVFWSAMTALCGLTRTFTQLLVVRFGVSAGESAATPVSQALISDNFPPRRRPFALSVFSSSIYFGTTFSAILGGDLSFRFGWQKALIVISLPGFILALLLWTTVSEPERGRFDRRGAPGGFRFDQAMRLLLGQPAFALVVAASTMGAFVNGAMQAWTPPFFGRIYHLDIKQLGLAYGLVKGVTGIVGVLLGGWLASSRHIAGVRRQLWLCTAAIAGAIPFFLAFVFSREMAPGLVTLALFQVLTTMPLGVSYAIAQELSPPATRALAAAIVALAGTLIGIGGGPLYVGILTDHFAAAHGQEAVRYALMLLVPFMLLGAIGYWAGSRAVARMTDPWRGAVAPPSN